MKVWITKCALTAGIREAEGHRCTSSGSPDMIAVDVGRYKSYFHGEGRDWHKSKESALRKAEDMRQQKIKSHQRSIEKLLKLSFPSG